ncbi:hypothetical protein AFCDBAGC_1124 [Methylobacterium cerastii]|uniref:Uncharacterized protein n=1 Tax=Methylobacterium cerastii TaxID=932741 RepID=A0ABQ4QDI0_9HYPH|nr:hypothetical protein AFCDBAGC_1124 [Methylobacterium cerastii]
MPEVVRDAPAAVGFSQNAPDRQDRAAHRRMIGPPPPFGERS